MSTRKTPLAKEQLALTKKENAWIAARQRDKTPPLNRLLDTRIPAGLRKTLNDAFFAAFETIFSRGNAVIGKTFAVDDAQKTFEINRYAASVKPNRKHLRAFAKHANTASVQNTALSGAAGIGMGLLGIGLPDIPLLVGFLLKSMYQIAQSYGFGYETNEERYFILLLLECAASSGEDAVHHNTAVDAYLTILAKGEPMQVRDDILRMQMRHTADALSTSLLYVKFIQGIPLIGVVGGFSDMQITYAVSRYAEYKYRRRFFLANEKTLS